MSSNYSFLGGLWSRSSEEQAAEAERAVMEVALGGDLSVEWKLRRTKCSAEGQPENYLSTAEVAPAGFDRAGVDVPVVLIHGLFASLGWWMRNYASLVKGLNRRVLAIDWLGHGCSSRPDWPRNSLSGIEMPWESTTKSMVEAGEQFMIEAVELWRIQEGIEVMDLVAHSTGGYFAALYALRYPHRVRRLVLASPCGLLDSPPEPESESKEHVGGWMVGLAKTLWSANVTPGGVVRWLGPLGNSTVNRVLTRRLGSFGLEEKELQALATYTFHTLAAKGSSEFCMNSLLQLSIRRDSEAGVYARRSPQSRLAELTMPVTLLHGAKGRDWMYTPKWELLAAESLPNFQLRHVPAAGHLVFIENPGGFNKEVLAALGDSNSNSNSNSNGDGTRGRDDGAGFGMPKETDAAGDGHRQGHKSKI